MSDTLYDRCNADLVRSFGLHYHDRPLTEIASKASKGPMSRWADCVRQQRHNDQWTDMFFEQKIRSILNRCCARHPAIVVNGGVLGGMPHIAGSRIGVDYVLDRLFVRGNTKLVAKYLESLSESQVKEAISFAQDFLETVCGSLQADD